MCSSSRAGSVPARHHADVEGCVAVAERRAVGVGVLRRAAQRLDQDLAGRPAQRGHPTRAARRSARPAARGRSGPSSSCGPRRSRGRRRAAGRGRTASERASLDQPRDRAQRAELLGILVRAGVARGRRRGPGVRACIEPRAGPGSSARRRRAASTSRNAAQRLANAVARRTEAAADDPLERMKAELEPRRDAEVAAPAAESPEQLGVLVVARPNHLARRESRVRRRSGCRR